MSGTAAGARIDLNADLGEANGGVPVADDEAMIALISSANIACGFHSGDARTMRAATKAAAKRGVAVGAHVAYRDQAGFGRRFIDYNPEELADEVLYQIGALDAIARSQGTRVGYVKPHGALYNAIVKNREQARAVVAGVRAFSDLPIVLLPGGVAIEEAENAGLTVVREAFADRGYTPEGTLVPRGKPGDLLDGADAVTERVLGLASSGTVTAVDGSVVDVAADSICVHGDSPDSVAMTEAIVKALDEAGVELRPAVGA